MEFKEKNRIATDETVSIQVEGDFVESAPVDKETLEKVYSYEQSYAEAFIGKATDIAIENFKNGEVKKVVIETNYRLEDKLELHTTRDPEEESVVNHQTDNFLKESLGALNEAIKKALS